MRELLNLFTDTESRDELGIGQVRDAFGDLLFPGTSTLHTRARYLVIVPWCYRTAARQTRPDARDSASVEQIERRLIGILKRSGATDGLIGRVAGIAVKTLPSNIYWGALLQYGIRLSPDAPLNRAISAQAESVELAERALDGWAPTLPEPPPGWPWELPGGLELTEAEAAWLRTKLRTSVPETLLVHLLTDDRCPAAHSAAPWDDPATADAPDGITQVCRDAQLFSLGMHGAALLYNLLVAEKYERAGLSMIENPVDTYRQWLGEWLDELGAEPSCRGWDRAQMWNAVIARNPRIATNLRLCSFVERWLSALGEQKYLSVDSIRRLGRIVEERERTVKRAQSRFVNDRLLRSWSGASGSRRLVYRWPQVARLLEDIHVGLGNLDAAT